VKFITLVAT